jgi:hypothetical protein
MSHEVLQPLSLGTVITVLSFGRTFFVSLCNVPLIPINYNNICVIEFQRRQDNNLTLWLELISGLKVR